MLIIVYSLLLVIFWILALRIRPEKYPHVDANALIAWRNHRLALYRRYAAMLAIWIVLFIANGVIFNIHFHHQDSLLLHTIAWVMVAATLVYVVVMSYFMIRNAYRNYQQGKAIGMYKR